MGRGRRCDVGGADHPVLSGGSRPLGLQSGQVVLGVQGRHGTGRRDRLLVGGVSDVTATNPGMRVR